MDDSTDTDEPATPGRAASGADDPDEDPTGDDTERSLEREVLTAAADDDSIADRAIAELQAAVTDEPSAMGDATTVGTTERRLSTDTLFELLSSPGNRFVLTYLLRADNPTTYADLVDYVVERAEPPPDTTDAKFRGRVAARLVHGNLPDLADAGLIERDDEEQTVRATPAIETAAPHLALAVSRSVAGDGPD